MKNNTDNQEKNSSELSHWGVQLVCLIMCATCAYIWMRADYLVINQNVAPSVVQNRYEIVLIALLFSNVASSRFSVDEIRFNDITLTYGLKLFQWFVWFFGLLVCGMAFYLWWSANFLPVVAFRGPRSFAVVCTMLISILIFSRCIVRTKFGVVKPDIGLEFFCWLTRLVSLGLIVGICIYLWKRPDLSFVEQFKLERSFFFPFLSILIFSFLFFFRLYIKKNLDDDRKKSERNEVLINYLGKAEKELVRHFTLLWVPLIGIIAFRLIFLSSKVSKLALF